MTNHLNIMKTYKLFINGQFPRTESGRTIKVCDIRGNVLAHVCQASRKDLRNAVEAAQKAQTGWTGRTAYNRGQILYRMAEMLQGKCAEFTQALTDSIENYSQEQAVTEVTTAIDRLVAYAGWADKYQQVLGCNNPVAGPFYNFTVPEATGVVGVITPDEKPLLSLVSLIAPPICAGNTVIALGSEKYPLATAIFGEVCATSDVPGGVINLLTGLRNELIEHFAGHREINALHAANLSEQHNLILRQGSAENIKRVIVHNFDTEKWFDNNMCHSPWWIEPFIEFKTIWHPARI